MRDNFLLKTVEAQCLYSVYAKDLPIIDFHNHVSVADIAEDRKFKNLTELWLASDPYKHRLMRICGVEERYITGDATDYEKFEKYCEIFPLLAGNPVYDWSRMELYSIFGIEQLPCKENAELIYNVAGTLLSTPAYTNNAILKRFGIAYQSPVAQLQDDLSGFDGVTVAPSLRGDNLLTGEFDMTEICRRLDAFAEKGCRFADHALDADFFSQEGCADRLIKLAGEYAKRGWTLLLHIGAKRNTSPRLAKLAGPAGGYAAAGSSFSVNAVCDLLGAMEASDGLPDTVLFPLNLSDQAAFAVLQGSYSQDGVASKVQLGPAWWWCDHPMGIENALNCIASFGVVSRFIGMTTDSRSILSFVRHDYFRRLLCSWLEEQNRLRQWELTPAQLGEMIQNICFENANRKIHRR